MTPCKLLTALAVICALSGCFRRQDYSGADEKVLCDPTSSEAFHVIPGAGDTSFVRRNPAMDRLCKS